MSALSPSKLDRVQASRALCCWKIYKDLTASLTFMLSETLQGSYSFLMPLLNLESVFLLFAFCASFFKLRPTNGWGKKIKMERSNLPLTLQTFIDTLGHEQMGL
uniref:Uncharacterized protein n=1 Tax=Opuntia streptacantha TaxID=393608 RepID=A0A7C9DD56_OPUST